MLAGAARAEFTVCNQTLDVVNLAIGQEVHEGSELIWQTEGWWTVGANQCAKVIRDELVSRFIYVYATDVFGQPLLNGTTPVVRGHAALRHSRQGGLLGERSDGRPVLRGRYPEGGTLDSVPRCRWRSMTGGRCEPLALPNGFGADQRCAMHEIDTSFRARKAAVAARRRKARWRKAIAAAAALAVVMLGVGFYLTADKWSIYGLDNDLVEVDTPGKDADVPVYVPAIVDLAGDPMTINIGSNSGFAPRLHEVRRPADLVEPGISEKIKLLSDVMLSTSESLMTTIPSSPEDFAFFQAQRTVRAPAEPDPQPAQDETNDAPPVAMPDETAVPPTDAAFSDEGAGWGETISEGEESLPDFKKTRIENNTLVVTVRPEGERSAASEDFVDKVLSSRTLDSLVIEHRFSAEDAKQAGEALKALLNKDQLDVGYVVAMRGVRQDTRATSLKLVQVSIYADAKYIGTLARDDSGKFVVGVDPWVKEDFLHYTGFQDQTGLQRQYRLLDAIYSTAVRNNVPTSVIGEAIMFLSRGQDLNAFATHGDRLILAYSEKARAPDGSGGRVLYAAVKGDQKNIECFVFRPSGSNDFACVTEGDQVYSLTVTNGMVTPVNGVMTSTFGPRMHPILKVGPGAQGRGLGCAGRHADRRRLRWHHRVFRRRRRIWQSGSHQSRRRARNPICSHVAFCPDLEGRHGGQSRRRCRLYRHDRVARPGRICTSRFMSEDRQSTRWRRRPSSRLPARGTLRSSFLSIASSAWKAAVARLPRTRCRRRPDLDNS